MKNLLVRSAIISTIIAISFAFVNPEKTYAKEICFTQYGGGETCVNVKEEANIRVDKTIYNPSSDSYSDHVKAKGGSYPYIFKKNEKVKFNIKVENTGEVKLEDVEIRDILPTLYVYNSGDGDSRKDGAEAVFDIGDLKPGESEEVTFTAKISDKGILPNDSYICITNIVKAEGEREDDNDEEEKDVDYANYCVQLGKVLGKEAPKVLPVTGSQDVLLIAFSVGITLVGYGIRKLAD